MPRGRTERYRGGPGAPGPCLSCHGARGPYSMRPVEVHWGPERYARGRKRDRREVDRIDSRGAVPPGAHPIPPGGLT